MRNSNDPLVTLRLRLPLSVLTKSKAYQEANDITLQRLITTLLSDHLDAASGERTYEDSDHDRYASA